VYGCETWSITLMAQHRVRVLANRALRNIFDPKTVEVTEESRRLQKG